MNTPIIYSVKTQNPFNFIKCNVIWKLVYKTKYISQIKGGLRIRFFFKISWLDYEQYLKNQYLNVTNPLMIPMIFIFLSCLKKLMITKIQSWKFKISWWITNHNLLSWTLANKTNKSITFQKPGYWDFWWIASCILNKSKWKSFYLISNNELCEIIAYVEQYGLI